jgi:(p)ppGpp synthase/HD superfamily hydrolase
MEVISLDNLDLYLSKARSLALEAHAGQLDKAGAPYIIHAETVSRLVREIINGWNQDSHDFQIKAQIVGFLHDIIEDTSITVEDLKQLSFPIDCIQAIETITKNDTIPYQDYIQNVKRNKLAAVVKMADMTHNSDLSRLPIVTEKDLKRVRKYQDAIEYLSTFTCKQCQQIKPLSEMSEDSTRDERIICQQCDAGL